MQRHNSLTSLSSVHSTRADSVRDTSTESLFHDPRFARKPRKPDSAPGGKPSYNFPNGEVFTPRSAPRNRPRQQKLPSEPLLRRPSSMVSVASAASGPYPKPGSYSHSHLNPSHQNPNPSHQHSSPQNPSNHNANLLPNSQPLHLGLSHSASSGNLSTLPNPNLSNYNNYSNPAHTNSLTSRPGSYLTRSVSFNNLRARSKQDLMASIRTAKLDTPTNISIPPPAKSPHSSRTTSLTNNRYAENAANIVRSESMLCPDQSPVTRAAGSDSNPSSISMYILNRSGSNTPQTSLSGSDAAEQALAEAASTAPEGPAEVSAQIVVPEIPVPEELLSSSESVVSQVKEITSLASIKESSSPESHASLAADGVSSTTSSPKSKGSAQTPQETLETPKHVFIDPVQKPTLESVASNEPTPESVASNELSPESFYSPEPAHSVADSIQPAPSSESRSESSISRFEPSTGGDDLKEADLESKRHSYAESSERTISSDVASQSTITYQPPTHSSDSTRSDSFSENPSQRPSPLSPRLSLSGTPQGWFGLLGKNSKPPTVKSSGSSVGSASVSEKLEEAEDELPVPTIEDPDSPGKKPVAQVVRSLLLPDSELKNTGQTSFSERKNTGLFLSLSKSEPQSSTVPEVSESEEQVPTDTPDTVEQDRGESISVDMEDSEIYSPVHIKQFLDDDQEEVPARKDLQIMDGKVKLHKRKPSTEISSPLVASSGQSPMLGTTQNPKFARNSMLAVVDVDFDKGLPPTPSSKRFAKGPLYENYNSNPQSPSTPKSASGLAHKNSSSSLSRTPSTAESKLKGFRKILGFRSSSKETLSSAKSATSSVATSTKPETRASKKKKPSFFSKFSSKVEEPMPVSPVYSVREKPALAQKASANAETTIDLPTFESDDHMFDDILLKFNEVEKAAEKEALSQKKTKSIHDFFLKDDELTRAQIFDQQKKDTVNSSESLISKINSQNDSTATLPSDDNISSETLEKELSAEFAYLNFPQGDEAQTIHLTREQLSHAWEVHDHRTYLKYVRQFADFEDVQIDVSGFEQLEHREIEPRQPSPILRKEGTTAQGRRRVQFSNHITISDTFAPHVYKRNNKAVTQYFVTEKAEINRIKNELNAYKCYEMLVHEKSQMNTHFYY